MSEETNFASKYSVLIGHPIATVLPVLAHGDRLEAVVRLSALCSDFQLLQSDTIRLLASTPLSKSRVRTQAPHAHTPANTSPEGIVLSRQAFRLQETIPLFFGLIKRTVDIVGTVTWDDDTKVSLYESVTEGQGIEVWKLREFAEVEVDGKVMTRVTETIEGKCPGWLRFIVQNEVVKSHKEHMDKYHTLYL